VLGGIVLLATSCIWGHAPRPRPVLGEAPVQSVYHPDRRDYASFLVAFPDLLEPNYLPFMAHRFERASAQGDALIFCRWSQSQMPIAVHVNLPVLDESVLDEFLPVRPEAYVQASIDALAIWERDLDGLVRFVRVETPEQAVLQIRLVGERAPVPVPNRQRLGAAERLVDACRSLGWDPDADRMRVRFELPELVIHLADEAGFLPTSIVRRLVLHELGHALGMRGHSPSPGDVMFPRLGDATGREALSVQDVNSFIALYELPQGAHFGDVPPDGPSPRPAPEPPSGGTQVDMAPYVDARRGFEISVPASWVHIEEPQGVFFSDGPSWDHAVSLRLFVWPAPTIERFMACCAGGLLQGAWFRQSAWIVVGGRRTLQLRLEDAAGERAIEWLVVELGDGRVMMIATESPVGYEAAWRPWFQTCLASLEIWPLGRDEVPVGSVSDPSTSQEGARRWDSSSER
jgi:hypothetical protein